jgi:hypothetical protein
VTGPSLAPVHAHTRIYLFVIYIIVYLHLHDIVNTADFISWLAEQSAAVLLLYLEAIVDENLNIQSIWKRKSYNKRPSLNVDINQSRPTEPRKLT